MRLARAAALLLTPLVVACGGVPAPEMRLTEPGWDVFVARLRRELAPIRQLEGRRQRDGIPLRFRLGEEAELDRRRARIEEGACGPTLTAFVRKLPAPSPERIGSETVLELGPGGAVLRSWPIPVEMSVAELRDEEIFVPHTIPLPGSDPLFVYLAIRPDGSFRVTRPGAVARRRRAECPELAEEEGRSARSCWVYPDGPAFRMLALPGPCF